MKRIGTVVRLRRYPVKSMRGEDLERVKVESYGFVGDRIYAYVVDHSPNERFPWMSARQAAEMLLYKPTLLRGDAIEVESPDGKRYSIKDHNLEKSIEDKYGYEISLKYRESGCHDSKPISLLGLQTVRKLEEETRIQELAPERFRANIYAGWDNDEPFFEDTLVGKQLSIGDHPVKLEVVKKDSRCVIPTLDPINGRASPEVFETIQTNHAGTLGVYAEVLSTGEIERGDSISLG